MNLLAVIPLIILQWSVADMEVLCTAPETPKEIMACNASRRINLGIFSIEQLPSLIQLHTLYRDSEAFSEAVDVGYRMTWLIGKNAYSGSQEALDTLTWMPEGGLKHDCFQKEGWQYQDWSGYCASLRYFIADSYIQAFDLTEQSGQYLQASDIATVLSYMVDGIRNEPLYKVEYTEDRITTVRNTDIPNNYRADIWTLRAKRMLDNMTEGRL